MRNYGPYTYPGPRPSDSVLERVARDFAGAPHLPQRTCLGCGGSILPADSEWDYAQCQSWGVELSGRGSENRWPVYHLSWSEVARIAKGGVQIGMAL